MSGRGCLALAVALAACQRHDVNEQRVVQRYLLCEECMEQEDSALLALGERGVQALAEASDGPPKDRIENMRHQANAMFDRIPSPAVSRNDYVAHYVGNYVAVYEKRAGRGLHLFDLRGTPGAHAALLEGIRRDSLYREDVRAVFGAAAGVAPSVLAGGQQLGPFDSLLKVDPSVRVLDSTTGHGVGHVRVVFHVDSGGGQIPGADSVQLTDQNGRATVSWRLGHSDTVNVLSAVAAGRTVRFVALGHPDGPRVAFLQQPSNTAVGQPITPPVRFEVQDAWGGLLPSVTLSAQVTVVPLGHVTNVAVTSGVAELTGFSVPQAGTGLRLRVDIAGAPVAISAPFDVTP